MPATSSPADEDVITVIDQFDRRSHQRRVPKANPRVADWVNCFNEVLFGIDHRRRFLVHPRCIRLIHDLRNLPADEQGMPDKSDQDESHASEACGYWIARLRPMIANVPLEVGGFVY